MMPVAPFSLLCVVSILGTLGNVFIIAAVCLRKKLRVRGNIFIVNLAVADLIVTGYIMPVGLVTSQYEVEEDLLNKTLCEFNAFLIMTTLGVSTHSLMLIAIERYVHICQAQHYKRVLRPAVCAALVVICWMYNILWTCQGWTGWTKYGYAESMYVCIFSAIDNTGTIPFINMLSYNICLAVFGIIIPLVVISVCYYKIFKTVRNSRRKLYDSSMDSASRTLKKKRRKLQQEYRLISMLFTIVILFILFWLPATLVLSLAAVLSMPYVLFTISIWTAFCNSCVNSIVYGVMNKNFRSGYVAMFRWIFCCGCSKGACARTSTIDDDSTSTSRNTNNNNAKARGTAHRTSLSMSSTGEGSVVSTTVGSAVSTEVSFTRASMKFNNIPMTGTRYMYQRQGLRQ